MSVLKEFQDKFKVNDYKIFESHYWIWSLRPHQATLGAGILSLKRKCTTLGELEPEEFTDLNNIIKAIESTLKNAFNYDVINYLMLMMVDKHVHYHIIPRYENPIKLFDNTWNDQSWPGIPNLAGQVLEDEKLTNICSYIKNNLII